MHFVNLSYCAFLFAGVSISWIKVLEYWSTPSEQRLYGVFLTVIGGVMPLIGFFCVRQYISDQFHDIESHAGIRGAKGRYAVKSLDSSPDPLRASSEGVGESTPISGMSPSRERPLSLSRQEDSGSSGGSLREDSGHFRKMVRFSQMSGGVSVTDDDASLEMLPAPEEEAGGAAAAWGEAGLRVGHKCIAVLVEARESPDAYAVTTHISYQGRKPLVQRATKRFTEFKALHDVYTQLGGNCTWPSKPTKQNHGGFLETDPTAISARLTEYMNAVLAVEFFTEVDGVRQSLGYLVPESAATASFLGYQLSDWSTKYDGNQLRTNP